MTGAEFRAWRESLGFSQKRAAEALGISVSRIADYENGTKRGTDRPAPVPLVVELACAELARRVRARRRPASFFHVA